MLYVLPTPPALRGRFPRLAGLPRLYACPAGPEPVGAAPFVIADSGAFGLSKRGKRLTPADFPRLEEHYLRIGATDRPPLVGVGPDVYLDPRATLRNLGRWLAAARRPVAPVVQLAAEGPHAVAASGPWLAEQAAAYRDLAPPFVLVSNPNLSGRSARAQGFGDAALAVRAATGCAWLHVLGAGWDLDDVRDWSLVPGVDSIDSVAWYESARRGEWWHRPADDWREVAYRNAMAAGLVAAGLGDRACAEARAAGAPRRGPATSYGLAD